MNDRIVEVARSFVGTRVVPQARLPGVGLDCGGVVVCVPRAIPELAQVDWLHHYGQQPQGWRLYRAMRERLDEIDPATAGPGSVVLWWVSRRNTSKTVVPQHMGILAGSTIIHADTAVRRVVEVTNGPGWKERVIATFQFRLVGASPDHRVDEKCKACEDGLACECKH